MLGLVEELGGDGKMPEVRIGKEELSGLGLILKQVMDQTLQDPKTRNAIKKAAKNLR